MKLLNVPPVKPGQKFRFENASSVYRVNRIEWSIKWQEWDVNAVILRAISTVYSVGEVIDIFIYSDDVVEILND